MLKGRRTWSRARRGLLGLQVPVLIFTGMAVIAPGPPVHAADAFPTDALVGPVRYTESGGAQDPVYGTPFAAVSDPYAEDPITSDDTVVLSLTSATTPSAAVWVRKTNAVFPAAGASADDTLTFADPGTAPTTLASATWFNLTNGTSIDDTVISTNIAVNSAGTYQGTVTIYNGSAPAMTSSSIVQLTNFTFTTSGRAASMRLSQPTVQLVATALDQRVVRVSVFDAAGKPTQVTTTDSIAIASTSPNVATATPAALTAADFDDTSALGVGSADIALSGGTTAGTTVMTFTPQGTLPSAGATPQTLNVTSIPLSSQSPTDVTVAYPTDQIFLDTSTTDDTSNYDVNDQFVTGILARGEGLPTGSGVLAYVSANSSNWVGLRALDTPDQIVPLANGASWVPVVLRTDSSGVARLTVIWDSVSDGGQLTVRIGSGSTARYTVVNVVDPTLTPTTVPSGRVLAKVGESTRFAVSLTDLFGNPYVGFKVSASAIAASGVPKGRSSTATTDSQGKATLTVSPPDDTYVGNARVIFSASLASGLPYPALSPPQVPVVYSQTGNPNLLTVSQAQSTPGQMLSVAPDDTLTTYPHIVVPLSGTARVGDGAVGTWSTLTSSGAAIGTMATFTPATSPPGQVVVKAPAGVFLTTSTQSTWNGSKSELTVTSGTPVRAFATRTGTHPITFTSGELKVTGLVKVSTAPVGAYNVAISPSTQEIATGGFGFVDVSVTDPFGNRVPNTTDDTGAVTLTASGAALLSGLTSSLTLTTDANGVARVPVIAGRSPGDVLLKVTPAAGTRVAAWQPGYVKPSGFPAPVVEAKAIANVTSTPDEPTASITIVGTRGTVQGKPGIVIDGATTNLDDSSVLTPWVRLAGQQGFTAGTTSIAVAFDGTFTWSRKTNKSAQVYVSTSDMAMRSNTVTIRQRPMQIA
jgi:hypothetical protein